MLIGGVDACQAFFSQRGLYQYDINVALVQKCRTPSPEPCPSASSPAPPPLRLCRLVCTALAGIARGDVRPSPTAEELGRAAGVARGRYGNCSLLCRQRCLAPTALSDLWAHGGCRGTRVEISRHLAGSEHDADTSARTE